MNKDLKEIAEGISQELIANGGASALGGAVIIADLIIALENAEKETALKCYEVAQNCTPQEIELVNNPNWNIGRLDAVIAIRKEFNLGE